MKNGKRATKQQLSAKIKIGQKANVPSVIKRTLTFVGPIVYISVFCIFFAFLLLLLLLNLHFLSRIFNWYSWCKRGLLLLILGRYNYLILQSMLQLFSSTIVSHSILLVLLCYVLRWLLRRAEDVWFRWRVWSRRNC